MSPPPYHEVDEHELPGIEAVLAGTLALMTGYSQALQAAAHPQQRLLMSRRITRQLDLLADHPQLSRGFRQVLAGLGTRWRLMSDCTEAAQPRCASAGASVAGQPSHCLEAPKRLQ